MSTAPREKIKQIMADHGFKHWQWQALEQPLSLDHYYQWLEQEMHGDMDYLKKSAEVKSDPSSHFNKAQTIISLSEDYFPSQGQADFPLKSLKVAHYATDEDYHFWLREKLQKLAKILAQAFPEHEFLAFTDAVPLLERDHAYQAGLGWIGKNTCLIDRQKGSLFFIGEILCTLPTDNEKVPLVHDFCGTCTKCMDECPTNAFPEPRVLDANRCIAYWTIEAKGTPPVELREPISDWFFGCDICQTVCPWNIKIHKNSANFGHDKEVDRADLVDELRWILSTSNKSLMKALGKTPLSRAGGRGLKRNAILVAGNKNLSELKPDIEAYLSHPLLGELAAWAVKRL